MKIPASDLERFKTLAIQLKAHKEGDCVRAGYALDVLLTRVEELEPKEEPKAPDAPALLKGKAK